MPEAPGFYPIIETFYNPMPSLWMSKEFFCEVAFLLPLVECPEADNFNQCRLDGKYQSKFFFVCRYHDWAKSVEVIMLKNVNSLCKYYNSFETQSFICESSQSVTLSVSSYEKKPQIESCGKWD